ncbi:hypothetical protein EON67_04400 [archaeon]|nr:MAG: hypothetical protein EON67_04400 [archaeon]
MCVCATRLPSDPARGATSVPRAGFVRDRVSSAHRERRPPLAPPEPLLPPHHSSLHTLLTLLHVRIPHNMATATGAPVGTTYAPGTMPATGGAVAVPVGTTAAPVQPVKKHPIRHLIRWLGWLILACHVLATFIPWYQIRKFSRPGGHGWGHINLTDYRACTHDDSVATPELSPSEACTLVPLRVRSYLRSRLPFPPSARTHDRH